MRVVDGIIMGPQCCAFEKWVFCEYHEHKYDCENQKKQGTQECTEEIHQEMWHKHQSMHSSQNLAGIRRMLQRSGEKLEWNPSQDRQPIPHDEQMPEIKLKHYFSPQRYYCVETLCAPCGAVIAWSKFADSKSPTLILEFLESVYPNPETHPQYICIDKACNSWKDTTQFIVDSYHYINHRVTDFMCQTYCNPAPLNGSAPNLACEQLNAWLGGFESILKRMVPSNFDWFLHAMLFYHGSYVIKQQQKKKNQKESQKDDNEDIDNHEDAESTGETYDENVNDDIDL
ncbi:hypothetical protein BDQ12DRAFT_696741 [Crucibulum laeve]|uniref:CxC6 like cysteine cluster associated with KDZ domain-containing protein n=1 Tax=Crucibulum laeve TaxID=68775 RepID=A0A5C3M7Y5_9AGAR|nr:hypothetical protein BDQ12DRAFT_696741 [Crucibulum laeve]